MTEAKHQETLQHIKQLKRLDVKQKSEIQSLKKRIHDIEVAQAMLVDVGQTRRPDLQNAIQKMIADPPVKLVPANSGMPNQ